MNNGKNISLGCAVLSTYSTSVHAILKIFSYFKHLICCELGLSRPFSACCSALTFAIFNIFFMRAKKQMIWPDTSRVIAVVEHLQSIWNVPTTQEPRSSIAKNCAVFTSCNCAVPTLVFAPIPKPALFRFKHHKPESFWKRNVEFMRCQQWIAMKRYLLLFDLALLCGGASLFLHKSVRLICATLSDVIASREQLAYMVQQCECKVNSSI